MSAINNPEDAKKSFDERNEKQNLKYEIECINRNRQRDDDDLRQGLQIKLRILNEKPIETLLDFAKKSIEENVDTQNKLLKHIEETGNIGDIDVLRTHYNLREFGWVFNCRCGHSCQSSIDTEEPCKSEYEFKSKFIDNLPCQNDDYKLFLEAINQYWFSQSIEINEGPFRGYSLTFNFQRAYHDYGYHEECMRMRLHKDLNLWKAFWQWSSF